MKNITQNLLVTSECCDCKKTTSKHDEARRQQPIDHSILANNTRRTKQVNAKIAGKMRQLFSTVDWNQVNLYMDQLT